MLHGVGTEQSSRHLWTQWILGDSFAGRANMSTGKMASALLLLLLICIKCSHSGVKKIKIHVPYYVKHVHHYKKVYVPKIHVIKHEHHHKKEYDHHHHHHDVYKYGPYRSYDKSIHEYPDDVYYDDIESKTYRGGGRKRIKPFRYLGMFSEQYKGWKDASDYSGEEDDYEAYHKSYNFKRRSGSGEDGEDEEAEKEREESLEGEEEEEEEEEENINDPTTPADETDIISITTTESPLH